MFFKKIKSNIFKPGSGLRVTRIMYYILLFSSIMLLLLHEEKPIDSMVYDIQEVVKYFGAFAILFYPVIISLHQGITGEKYDYFNTVITGLFAYLSALWLIGKFGDDVKSWVIESPDNANIVIISLVIIWLIIQVSTWMSPRRSLGEPVMGVAYSSMPMPRAKELSNIEEKGSVGDTSEKKIAD